MTSPAPDAPIRSWCPDKIWPGLRKRARQAIACRCWAGRRQGRKRGRRADEAVHGPPAADRAGPLAASCAYCQNPQVTQDALFLRNGEKVVGRLTAFDG